MGILMMADRNVSTGPLVVTVEGGRHMILYPQDRSNAAVISIRPVFIMPGNGTRH
jgi:hypothetical protein